MPLYNVVFEFVKTVDAENEDEAYEIASERLYDDNMSDWDSVEIEEISK